MPRDRFLRPDEADRAASVTDSSMVRLGGLPAERTSLARAFAVAGVYALLAGAYVLVSGQAAASEARTVPDLHRLELTKDLVLVGVTALVVFFGTWYGGRRSRRDIRLTGQRERARVAQQTNLVAGALAASVAHDANNVLVALLGEVETLATNARARGIDASVTQLRAGIDRLVALNGRLLGMPMEWTVDDVARTVQDSIASMRTHGALVNCPMEYVGPSSVPMPTLPVLVHQIVGNLVLNACEAMSGRGRIEVRLVEEERRLVLEVHDTGPGVPRERRATLFDSMASTKPGGFGLGLYSVRACAELLGGRAEVADSPLGGALFRVLLPRSRATATDG